MKTLAKAEMGESEVGNTLCLQFAEMGESEMGESERRRQSSWERVRWETHFAVCRDGRE